MRRGFMKKVLAEFCEGGNGNVLPKILLGLRRRHASSKGATRVERGRLILADAARKTNHAYEEFVKRVD